MVQNISGKWKFTEEFECGIDKGFAYLVHNENLITGYLEYEETIEDEEPFMVKQEISGTIHNNHVNLKGEKVTTPNGTPLNDYNLDTLVGVLTHEGKIVGHSFDSNDVCGVFVFMRED
jgi:hypothetical protein